LNMIRFPDRDPTRFCTSEPDWTGFRKKLYHIRYGYPNSVDHCSQMFNRSFFRIYAGLDQIFGQCYRIRIGLDYTMKILDWIWIANITDPFNTNVDKQLIGKSLFILPKKTFLRSHK